MKDIPTIIKPSIISWARKRLGLDMDGFAMKMGVSVDKANAWESGDEKISWKKAEKLSNLALIPFGLLFLPAPPDLNPSIADFRTVNNANISDASPELQATIQNATIKQAWMSAYYRDNGESPLPFAGSMSLDTPIKEASGKIRTFFGDCGSETRRWEEYFQKLAAKIENSGIMLMRNSIVQNKTNRPLDANEFRGFVLYDQYAPLIFINSADSKNAQLFTLIHELVHIFIARGGVSNNDIYNVSHNAIERFCNQVAAEFLVPSDQLITAWQDMEDDEVTKIEFLSRKFKVSKLVMIRRCRDCNLITRMQFDDLWSKENSILNSRIDKKSGGPSFYDIATMRIGRNFSRAVISELRNDKITYTEAFRLLDIKSTNSLSRLEQAVEVPEA